MQTVAAFLILNNFSEGVIFFLEEMIFFSKLHWLSCKMFVLEFYKKIGVYLNGILVTSLCKQFYLSFFGHDCNLF